ncbi:unnamed protein product [Phytophthora fragariaefolia]|uniref:Unnamed protein product n=1 Tax=Phytophthora fragariaefolia TaxID=1490495 RepID=A0A9W6TTN4_9STRA|nr:unnamed protein product [Phytophthora fragariaefolia]
METRQDSALEKLNTRLDLEVARRFGPRAQGASKKTEDVPSQADDASVRREAETQEAARLEAVCQECERAAALLAQYRAQAEAHQAEEARRVTAMVESMQQEPEDMRVGRTREQKQPKSDSDSRSESSDQDSYHSDSSSFKDVVPNAPTVAGPGGTMFTFRPYVNASALEDFDEKASLAVRTRWLERFQRIAVQDGWTDKVNIYEMKMKLSSAVRNWLANLRPKRKSESPLEFFYHLNKVADKAGIDFDSSSKQQEQLLKVFTKKLWDSRLRTTLQDQLIRKLRDLEYVLKQHEEMTQLDDYDGPPPKRDFRADNVPHGRFQPKRSGRAYVVQDEDSPDEEDDREHKTSQVPFSGSSRTPDEGRLRMESFDQHQDHLVSRTGIASNSVNAAMISDILLRVDGPTSSVIAVAAKGPGQPYGWWEEHNSDETKKGAMVHGAVNNCRTDILLDSGASVSMMSLDLARRLKLRFKFCKRLRVSGLGGVPTIITATTEVKLTLGLCVVYIMELWVANIGEGVDVLLGMNFMYSAGVRLCAREGLVKLPDEETVLLAGRAVPHGTWSGPGSHSENVPVPWSRRISRHPDRLRPEEVRKREERLAQLRRVSEPPWVRAPEYQWPKILMVRSSTGSAQVHMVQLQPRPNVEAVKSLAKTDVQLSETEFSGTSDTEGAEAREAKLIEDVGDSHEDSGSPGVILEDRDPVIVQDEDSDSDGEAFCDAISFDGDDGGEDS